MRNMFADCFYELAKTDPRLAVVVADISPAGSIAKFREEFPDRFINTGVAEQIMIGLTAGMALRGMRPFAYTIATFSLFRPYEFVRDDLAYQDLPVTVVGIGGGVSYSTLGGTHHAMEDVALACAVPNMQVMSPCDPTEVRLATRWLAQESQHPTYLRLGKAGEPDMTANAAEPFEFGKLRHLTRGSDVCILSYGPIMKLANDVAARFREAGQSVSLVSVHTLKPLDREGVVRALQSHARVVVIEEMVPTGGLGPQVKGLAWDCGATCRLDVFGLQDAFIHCYGSHGELLSAHGLDVAQIWAKLQA